MNRPRVRFDGLTLDELPARWAHAQNDALGYFLWAYCRMAGAGRVAADGELLALIALYFERIRYWEDEDSGHWEERRKLEASSVGAVVAGLRALRDLLSARPDLARGFEGRIVTPEWLEAPIASGETALAAILPAECADADPLKARRYDAALLFLVYPLDVVDDAMARRIVEDVTTRLGGDHGVRRYLGDSYWGADYKDKLPPGERTADFSERLAERDARVQPRPGEEAQWCIFDPIVSVIAGRRYLLGGDSADLDRQLRHFNRALGQITAPDCPRGALRCPEAYYLERGVWVPNDHVPLLWTQANLRLALSAMEASAARAGW
jgi:phosphorylase kinase alpha/beta subunit